MSRLKVSYFIFSEKRKKLKKLAGKLNIKKNKSADDKTEQDREALETSRHLHPLLQPLVKSKLVVRTPAWEECCPLHVASIQTWCP